MSKKKKRPHARIAITLPPEVLAAADRLAERLDRSRSWVIAESIRRYVAGTANDPMPGLVRESRAGYLPDSASGLGPLRLAQLEADLRLSPEARVLAAEDTARLDRALRPGAVQRLLLFGRFEDYLAWKQREAVGS